MPLALLAPRLALAALVLLPIAATAQRTDTTVRMAGAPRYAGIATLVEELSIGVVDGPEEYVFGDVADVAVAKDGSVYVLDRSIRGVRMYDATGKYLRTIGRRGQGPGEIMTASGIAVLHDGRLVLWDTGNWRVNVYSAAGANLGQWLVPSTGTGSAARAIVADTSGFVYAKKTLLTRLPAGQLDPIGRPFSSKTIWLRIRGSDGAIVDTIAQPELPEPEGLTATNASGSTAKTGIPFNPATHLAMSPFGYLVTGNSARYAVELRQPGGPVLSIRRDVPPEPVTAAERDAERKRVEALLRETDPAWTWGSQDIPKTKPFYAAIAVGVDGRIWLARDKSTAPDIGRLSLGGGSVGVGQTQRPRPQPEREPGTQRPTRFDVFDPTGAFIGAVTAPPGVSFAVMRGDYVWGVARNEDDVAFVKRYKILWK